MDKRKYIIELPDDEHLISWWTYIGTEDGKQHIDFHEVVKAPYKGSDPEAIKQEAYEKGLSDAWDAARKIYLDVNKGGLSVNALTIIFGNKSTNQILKELSVFEAIKKIRQYEHGQEEQIQVGDEINAPFGKAVVVDVDSNAGKSGLCMQTDMVDFYASRILQPRQVDIFRRLQKS